MNSIGSRRNKKSEILKIGTCLLLISLVMLGGHSMFGGKAEATSQEAEVHYNNGNKYFKEQQYDSAIVKFDQSIVFNPKFAVAYNNRGNADYDQAKQRIAALE